MSDQNPFDEIRHNLDKYGWVNTGGYGDRESGYCMVGAHIGEDEEAELIDEVVLAMKDAIMAHDWSSQRALNGDSIPVHPDAYVYNFNDHQDTTRADVDLIIGEAEQLWKERVHEHL